MGVLESVQPNHICPIFWENQSFVFLETPKNFFEPANPYLALETTTFVCWGGHGFGDIQGWFCQKISRYFENFKRIKRFKKFDPPPKKSEVSKANFSFGVSKKYFKNTKNWFSLKIRLTWFGSTLLGTPTVPSYKVP